MPVNSTRKIELLAPAGNFEKLEIVLHYGADAVYLAGKDFSLRNFSGNFSLEEIEAALRLAHARGAKVYVAVNIFARNRDLPAIERYLDELNRLNPDAIIAADPAIVMLARKIMPAVPIHLSTQANTTNSEAARFWALQGVSRINAARELTLVEIAQLAADTGLEIEAFVHGAMCISYSGRCLLSNYLAQRPSNQGMCCQPCRSKYALVEETRPGQYFPVAEDREGTYVFNSKDLCMLAHLPALIGAGLSALKIEGRMKGIHYAATAVKIYREALDAYYAGPAEYAVNPAWQEELDKISARGYCTGFYLGEAQEVAPSYAASKASATLLAAKVLGRLSKQDARIDVRNQIRTGDMVEILRPKGPVSMARIEYIRDQYGREVQIAQPGTNVTVKLDSACERLDLLRKILS